MHPTYAPVPPPIRSGLLIPAVSVGEKMDGLTTDAKITVGEINTESFEVPIPALANPDRGSYEPVAKVAGNPMKGNSVTLAEAELHHETHRVRRGVKVEIVDLRARRM